MIQVWQLWRDGPENETGARDTGRGRFDRNWEPVLTDEQLSRLCAERAHNAAAVLRGSQ